MVGGDEDWWKEAGQGGLFRGSDCKLLQQGWCRLLTAGSGTCTSWWWLRVPAAESDVMPSGPSSAVLISCPSFFLYRVHGAIFSGQTFKSLSTGGELCFPQVLSGSEVSKPALSVTDPEHLIVLWKGSGSARASLWQPSN